MFLSKLSSLHVSIKALEERPEMPNEPIENVQMQKSCRSRPVLRIAVSILHVCVQLLGPY